MIDSLNELASLHPDLIYYYLLSLCKDNKNAKINLTYAKVYYQKRKSAWISGLEKLIHDQIKNTQLINEANKLLSVHKIIIKDKVTTDVKYLSLNKNEKNIRDYLVLKYYAINTDNKNIVRKRYFKNEIPPYNKEYDYTILRQRIESRERKNLYQRAIVTTDIKVIELIIKYYYLFDSGKVSGEPSNIYSMLNDILKRNLKNYQPSVFAFLAGYRYLHNLYVAENSVPLSFTTMKLRARNFISVHSFVLGFHYIFAPYKQLQPTTYLKFNLNLSINKIPHYNYSSNLKNKYNVEGYDYTEKIFYNAQYSSKASYGMAVDLLIPIFRNGRNMVVELGLLSGFHYIKYQIKYYYEYQKYIGFWTNIGESDFYRTWKTDQFSDTASNKNEKWQLYFLPIVNINFTISPKINIEFKGSYKFVSVIVSYKL